MADENKIFLKIPLLQTNNESKGFKKLLGVKENGCINFDNLNNKNYSSEMNDKSYMNSIEDAIGRYCKYTGKLDKLYNLYFPKTENIKLSIEKYLSSNYEFTEIIPLIFISLFKKNYSKKDNDSNDSKEASNITDNNDKIIHSQKAAWANLVFELGLFIYEDQIEKNKEIVNHLINYVYRKNNNEDCFSYYANIKNIDIKEIWERLITDDVKLIFIDDDMNFGHKYGFNENITNKCKKKVVYKAVNDNVHWIYPGRPFNNAKNAKDVEQSDIWNETDKILTDKKKLYIFVVDFIYKNKDKNDKVKNKDNNKLYNKILVNEIIKNINKKYHDKDIHIIGYTGGESPFIINSADKVGADIVIFKKRGGTYQSRHNPAGNPTGLFDLLWAISWNVSVWKTLKILYCKYCKIENNSNKNQELLSKTLEIIHTFFPEFPQTGNLSPFWKRYLKKFEIIYREDKLKELKKHFPYNE